MPKRIVYTKITPLPSNVPRQLALDMLHSHGEIIELNPLVTGHKPISSPRDAARDEYFAQWYEIEEIITWGFGMKKKIAFKGCFHDMPWGLQTHIYAPMGVDLRNKYQIAGNQPGEPKEVRELGIDAPAEGLYLKEDVEITCNIALASFVKKETKQTLETMIERMTKKAELLDDGILMAMFENGRLKTLNPGQINQKDRLNSASVASISPLAGSSPDSPPLNRQDFSPAHTFTTYSQLPGRMNTKRVTQPQAFEMEGSPGYSYSEQRTRLSHETGSGSYYQDDKSRYQYPTSNVPTTFTAELADTSTTLAPYQHSNLSFAQSNRGSSIAPSVHSRHSRDDSRTSGTHGAEDAHRMQDDSARPGAQSGGSSSYTVTNPDQREASTPPYPTSRDAYTQAGLAQQIGGLLISSPAAPNRAPPTVPAKIARCPMGQCDFEGSSEAISQHVNRHHFA